MNKKTFELSPMLAGDGRRILKPSRLGPAAISRPMRCGTGRFLALKLLESGVSRHSQLGSTVWLSEEFLDEQGIPYRTLKNCYGGFTVEVTDTAKLAEVAEKFKVKCSATHGGAA